MSENLVLKQDSIVELSTKLDRILVSIDNLGGRVMSVEAAFNSKVPKQTAWRQPNLRTDLKGTGDAGQNSGKYLNWGNEHNVLLIHMYVCRLDLALCLRNMLQQKIMTAEGRTHARHMLSSLNVYRVDKETRFPIDGEYVNILECHEYLTLLKCLDIEEFESITPAKYSELLGAKDIYYDYVNKLFHNLSKGGWKTLGDEIKVFDVDTFEEKHGLKWSD